MSDPTRFSTGWLLDPDDREMLLALIPPRYSQVVAHHVTLKFAERAPSPPTAPPAATTGEVVGVADDGQGVQAVVVRIGGTTDRPDGSTYHITWSLEPAREARESNAVIAAGGWRDLAPPIPIRLQTRPFDS